MRKGTNKLFLLTGFGKCRQLFRGKLVVHFLRISGNPEKENERGENL